MKPQSLNNLLLAVRRHIDTDMSTQKLSVLLCCLSQPDGIDQSSLVAATQQTRSAVSKNIADLTHLTSRKKPGPGILRSEPDPMNLSVRIITVTPHGKTLWQKILKEAGL